MPIMLEQTFREPIPIRPWYVERYGYSLATVRDNNGNIVIATLNVAIAEYIVSAVNQYGPIL